MLTVWKFADSLVATTAVVEFVGVEEQQWPNHSCDPVILIACCHHGNYAGGRASCSWFLALFEYGT